MRRALPVYLNLSFGQSRFGGLNLALRSVSVFRSRAYTSVNVENSKVDTEGLLEHGLVGCENEIKFPSDTHQMRHLLVDSREPAYIQSPFVTRGSKSVALPAGDFWITDRIDEDSVEESSDVTRRPLVIVERKTVSDLGNALLSSRWKSQLRKLLYYKEKYNAHIILIVEGSWTPMMRWKDSQSRLQDLVRSIVLFSPCAVHRTANVAESIESVLYFAKRTLMAPYNPPTLTSQLSPMIQEPAAATLAPQYTLEERVDSEHIIQPTVSLLTGIHGLSLQRARRIATVFPTLKDLVLALNRQEQLWNEYDKLEKSKRTMPKTLEPVAWLTKSIATDGLSLFGPKLALKVYGVIVGQLKSPFELQSWKDMLCQVRGISPPMASSIAELYPTPSALINKYASLSETEAQNLFNGVSYGKSRNFGKLTSLKLYSVLYVGKTLDEKLQFPLPKA